jgi:RNA polymerase sigma factor (sigma-70 family)
MGVSADRASGNSNFESLVCRHQAAVTRLAYRLLGWRHEAVEDVVQEVFLAALMHLDRFRGEAEVATWLTRITINCCRTLRRRNLVRLRWLRRQRPTDTAPAGDADADTGQRVRDAVARLPARDREVIVLRYLEQLEIGEIARLLGTKHNAVEVRLHRARTKLRTLLDDPDDR